MPDVFDVPPDELVEPPEDPPDEDVEPPDEVEPPDDVDDPPDDVELPPLVLLVELPPELVEPGSVPLGLVGSVPLVSDASSDPGGGLAKSSLSLAPPQAASRANDEATAALMRRRGFMRVAKH